MKKNAVIVLCIVLGILFGFISGDPRIHSVNLAVSRAVQSVQPEWFISLNITVILFEYVMVASLIPLIIYSWIRGRRKETVLLIIISLSWFVSRMLKWFFKIPCPVPPDVIYLYPYHQLSALLHSFTKDVIILNSPICYPSGHVFNYVSFWGLLGFLRRFLWHSQPVRKFVLFLSVILISLIGEALVSVGGHWFLDILGGYLFGFAWLLLITKL